MKLFQLTRRHQTSGERKDLRLMTGHFSRLYAVLAAIIMAGCGVFFVCTARTATYVEGLCYNYTDYMLLLVPVNQADNVHIGDAVWSGNERGEVIVSENEYWDYSMLYNEYGTDLALFDINPSAVYAIYYAWLPEAASGVGRYRIITGEERLFGSPGK